MSKHEENEEYEGKEERRKVIFVEDRKLKRSIATDTIIHIVMALLLAHMAWNNQRMQEFFEKLLVETTANSVKIHAHVSDKNVHVRTVTHNEEH